MHQNANAGLAPGAAVIDLDRTITAIDKPAAVNRQAAALLLEQARRRHRALTKSEWRALERQARGRDARHLLTLIPRRAKWVATALDVTDRSIGNWRAVRHAPQPRHWRRLQALALLCTEARNGGARHPHHLQAQQVTRK